MQYHIYVGHGLKCGSRYWNRVAESFRLTTIATSGVRHCVGIVTDMPGMAANVVLAFKYIEWLSYFERYNRLQTVVFNWKIFFPASRFPGVASITYVTYVINIHGRQSRPTAETACAAAAFYLVVQLKYDRQPSVFVWLQIFKIF